LTTSNAILIYVNLFFIKISVITNTVGGETLKVVILTLR